MDAAEGFRFGCGVATVSGEPRPTAVTLTPPDKVASWVESTRITLCETSREVYSALDLTVDTSASYGAASMDDRFSVAQTCDRLASSLYLVVRAVKYSPLTVVKDVALTADARTLLDNENYADFFMRFGDAFVTGIVMGGEYAAVLAIDSNSEDTTREIKNSLGLTGAFGDFSASVQTSVTSTLKRHSQQLQVHVVTYSRGGVVTASQTTTTTDLGSAGEADDILTAVRRFPGSVDNDNAFPLTAQLSEYTELAMTNPQGFLNYLYGPQGLLVVARKTLSDLAATRALLVAQLARAHAVLSNPFGYTTPAVELRQQFEQYRGTLQHALDEIPAAAAEYAHHVAVYGDASGVRPRTITPPATLQAPPRVPRPTYLIRSYVNNRALALSLSQPTSQLTTGTAAATIELQPADPTDRRQFWVIPDLGAGEFTIQSAWSGEYASWNNDGIHMVREPAKPATAWTLWASLFRRDDAWVVAPSGAGGVMNASGDQYGPGTPIILWGFNYGDNCYWVFEPHDPATPPDTVTPASRLTIPPDLRHDDIHPTAVP
jgi:MAC/Perforin domain-containing protein